MNAWFYTLPLLLLLGCGTGQQRGASNFNYRLEHPATSLKNNRLLFDISTADRFLFAIDGEGFTANVPFATPLPLVDAVDLGFDVYGEYKVELALFQDDGTPVLRDTLHWEHDYIVPPTPVVAFNEEATADADTVLQISGARGPGTNELWVEGDVEVSPEGSWLSIPRTHLLPLRVSAGDGTKTITVKYRNKYGVESVTSTLSIVRKSTVPSACAAALIATRTPNDNIRVQIKGEDSGGELYYRILGDVATPTKFERFTKQVEASIKLTQGDGAKALTVLIRDQAENYCLRQNLTVVVDPAYEPTHANFQGRPVWTDNRQVVLDLHTDHFADDVVEVYLSTGVEPGPSAYTWLPYSPTLAATLADGYGDRVVYVQFRRNGAIETAAKAATYLRPSFFLRGTAVPYAMVFSQIPTLESLTVTGCQETYQDVPYRSGLTCTPVGEVRVTYKLAGGDVITRAAVLP